MRVRIRECAFDTIGKEKNVAVGAQIPAKLYEIENREKRGSN